MSSGPRRAFATPTAPIVICVLGADPFGSVLDQTMAGQHSQQRPLSVRRVADAHDAEGCHVAFIGKPTAERPPASEQASQWLDVLADRPVLTITEHLDALDQGAMLSFVSEVEGGQARIRFEASLPPMHRAGLTPRSQMLVAARKVHRDSPASERRGTAMTPLAFSNLPLQTQAAAVGGNRGGGVVTARGGRRGDL